MERLLFISLMPSKYNGASEWVFIETAKTAKRKGFEVMFSVPFFEKKNEYLLELENYKIYLNYRISDKCENIFLKGIHKIKRMIAGYSDVPNHWYELLIETKNFNPDLIFINEGVAFQTIENKDIWFLLNETNIPAVVFNHGYDELNVISYDRTKFLKENYFPRFKKIYFLSLMNYMACCRQFGEMIPNCSIVKNMNRLFGSRILPFPRSKKLKMAMNSRLDARVKGHHLVLEALSNDFFKSLDWELSIYGYGPDEELIKSWIQFFNLGNKVHLLGEAKDIVEVWSKNHVILQPSLLESHGQAIAEAAILGRPALVTPVGDMQLIVQDGVTGFVAPGIGVPALRMALQRLMQTPYETLEKMGLAAAEHVQKFIDPEPWVTLLEDLLTLLPSEETHG
ncbi:MAG: glycosyltransferase [Flavobacteriales bacterium]|nr:glycosyltransferase [Flavobacteriales bacterium]